MFWGKAVNLIFAGNSGTGASFIIGEVASAGNTGMFVSIIIGELLLTGKSRTVRVFRFIRNASKQK